MCSVNIDTDDCQDEFQKKSDAVSETLAQKANETGLAITDIISVKQSFIHQIESLQCLGDGPCIDVEAFLLSTLDKDTSPIISDDERAFIIGDDLSVLGMLLFALFQQRCNNPPDDRFKKSPYPQLLVNIPFDTTFLSDENSTSVVFTVVPEEVHGESFDDVIPVADNFINLVVDEDDKSPTPKKRGRGRPCTKTSTATDEAPRIAKRARTPNSKYIPPEATHKNNLAKDCAEAPVGTNKKRGGRRKAEPTKAKEVQTNRPLLVSQPTSPAISDIEEHSPTTRKRPKAATQSYRTADYSNVSTTHLQLQPSSTGGTQQLELMKTIHEYDKQNAVLRAQLDFVSLNADRAAKIQSETKALCFEILDKGADLTKRGATVATENNSALSTTISTVVAATASRREEAYSGTFSAASNNHMMFPVLTAAPPTIVNLSTQSISTEESARVSISSTPVTTVQQQHPVQTTATPPFSSVGLPHNSQPQLQLPQHSAITPFYPTIQGNISLYCRNCFTIIVL